MTVDDLRSADVADVYKGDDLAGQLVRDGTDIVFRYDRAYRDDPSTAPVAWTLPKRNAETRATGESVPPFFAGLLPEGARLRAVVAGTRTSEDDHFTLLLAVGADAVGDVSVVPEGHPLAEPRPALDPAESATLDLRDVFDRIVGPESLSYDSTAIPGVQPKVSAAMLSSPLMTARGPALLKLNPAQDYPRLVENEHFFLRMARACELRVPDHQLIHDRYGRSGLIVRRFDRVAGADGLTRLAQEDSCQVLGVYPARKYRLKTEDIVATLASRCEDGHGSRPAATLRLLHLVAFSYLIGNGDLHGKNFSIGLTRDQRWEPTPAYDLVSTQPYLGWRDPMLARPGMALDLYGRINRLSREHLMTAAERLGVPPRAVARMLQRLCTKAGSWVDQVDEIGLDARPTDLLRDLIAARLRELSPS